MRAIDSGLQLHPDSIYALRKLMSPLNAQSITPAVSKVKVERGRLRNSNGQKVGAFLLVTLQETEWFLSNIFVAYSFCRKDLSCLWESFDVTDPQCFSFVLV